MVNLWLYENFYGSLGIAGRSPRQFPENHFYILTPVDVVPNLFFLWL